MAIEDDDYFLALFCHLTDKLLHYVLHVCVGIHQDWFTCMYIYSGVVLHVWIDRTEVLVLHLPGIPIMLKLSRCTSTNILVVGVYLMN